MTIVVGGLFYAIKLIEFKTSNLPIGGDNGFNVATYFWIGIVVNVFRRSITRCYMSCTAKLTGHLF
jgi:hypothetical protein